MSDYSWIKPGVKAVIINDDEPKCREVLMGRVVTISDYRFCDTVYGSDGEVSVSGNWVYLEEGREIAAEFGRPYSQFVTTPRNLKPYKDDDSRDITTWDEITRIVGVDITAPEKVI